MIKGFGGYYGTVQEVYTTLSGLQIRNQSYFTEPTNFAQYLSLPLFFLALLDLCFMYFTKNRKSKVIGAKIWSQLTFSEVLPPDPLKIAIEIPVNGFQFPELKSGPS
mgnify:CR=1 FL=1